MNTLPELTPVIATTNTYTGENGDWVAITDYSHPVDNIAGNFLVSPGSKGIVTSPTGFVEYTILVNGDRTVNDTFKVVLPSGENPGEFIDLQKHGIVHIAGAPAPEGAVIIN